MFMKIWSVSRARCMAGIALFALLLAGCGEIKNAGGGGGGAGGGGGSNPVPGIIALDPKSAAAGGPDFFLTIYGTGFLASSVVEWNGVKLATTFVNDTLIFAQVDAVNRSASATVPVAVFNPSPGGGLSNTMPVVVGPVPSPPAGVGVLQLISAAPDGRPEMAQPTRRPPSALMVATWRFNLIPPISCPARRAVLRESTFEIPA